MKPVIREILQYVNDHPEMTTIAAIDSYFDQFLFSLEKQQWDDLTDQVNSLIGGFTKELRSRYHEPTKD